MLLKLARYLMKVWSGIQEISNSLEIESGNCTWLMATKISFSNDTKNCLFFFFKVMIENSTTYFFLYLIFQRGLGLWMWRTRRVDENRLVTCLCWRKGLTSPVWIDLLEEKSFSPSDSCGNIKSNFTEMDILYQEFHKIRLKCNKCYFLWVI